MAFFRAIFESHFLEICNLFGYVSWVYGYFCRFFNVLIIGGYLAILWLFLGIFVGFSYFSLKNLTIWQISKFSLIEILSLRLFNINIFTFYKTDIFCNKIFAHIRLIFKWLFWLFFKRKMAIFSKFNLAIL